METIKVTEKDGTVRIFNPMHITDAKLVVSEYAREWCVTLSVSGRTYTYLYGSKEEAEKFLNEINECLESI